MNGFKLGGILVLTSTLALSGCVARTYNLTRDRIDQDLSSSSGNRGYIVGKAPEPSERNSTRTVRIFEIELGKTKQTPGYPAATSLPAATEEPVAMQEPLMEEETAAAPMGFENYTVVKNDTLQKISQKFYGTTKNWMKIYEANKDVLRGPDKLYPGQLIKIPSAGIQTETQPVETKENLK